MDFQTELGFILCYGEGILHEVSRLEFKKSMLGDLGIFEFHVENHENIDKFGFSSIFQHEITPYQRKFT